jgi:hypothetical protein
MCETQMKEEGGRLRIVGGGDRCYCLCIDTVLSSNLMVARSGVATRDEVKC